MTSTSIPSNTAPITTWLDWFQSRESCITIDQAQQEMLFATFNSTVSKSDSTNHITYSRYPIQQIQLSVAIMCFQTE